MGGYLVKSTKLTQSSALLYKQINRYTLRDIVESVTILSQDYQGFRNITLEQFEDTFGALLDDASESFVLLQNKHDVNGNVDIYESLAVFIILSRENIKTKVKCLFEIFDFDQSGFLNNYELSTLVRSSVRGLCKFTGVAIPSYGHLDLLTASISMSMDADNNKRINLDEFSSWVNEDDEIQEFLVRHTQQKNLEHIKKRFRSIQSLFNSLFETTQSAASPLYISEDFLRRELQNKAAAYINPSEINLLVTLLKDSFEVPNDPISSEAYNFIIRAWSAFLALDYNTDGRLSKDELKTLLWIYEDQEPSEIRMKTEMEAIGNSQHDLITKEEWIRYFCISDSRGQMRHAKVARDLFERLDLDKSGSLSMEEMKIIAVESFGRYSNLTDDVEKKRLIVDMINSINKEAFKELDKANRCFLNWVEFKRYMQIAEEKHEKLRVFLDKYL